MVAIRLTRTGAKKKPSYRVVVIDNRRARDSKTLEIVGHYNPRPDPIELNLERERIGYWLGVGAQPSDTVKRLIRQFDEKGPSAVEPKRKAMQEAAAAAPPAAKPAPKADAKVEVEVEVKPEPEPEVKPVEEAPAAVEAPAEDETKPEAEA